MTVVPRRAYRRWRACVVALAAAAGAGTMTRDATPASWTRIDAGRGLVVVAVPASGAGVTVEAWLGGGADDEDEDGDGVAHLAEHVALAQAGPGPLDGRVTPGATLVRATAGELRGALAPVWAAITAARVEPAALDGERRAIAREAGHRDREARVGAALWRRVMRGPAHGRRGRAALAANEPARAAVAPAAIERWWATQWRARPATLVVRGEVAPAAIEDWTGRWPGVAAGGPARAAAADAAVTDGDRRVIGLVVDGVAAPAGPSVAVAAAAARLAGARVELLGGGPRSVLAIDAAGAGLAWPARRDRTRWAQARAAAMRLPLPGVFGAVGAIAAGQHLAGDPAWATRYRAAVAATTADEAIAILRALEARRLALADPARPARALRRARPAPSPRRRAPAQRTVAGGVRVVVAAEPDAPTVAIRLLWPGGLALESAATAGRHALAAAALTDCAEATIVDALGGSLAVVIERERFGLRAELPVAGWRDGLAAIAACLRAPSPSRARLGDAHHRLDAIAAAAAGSATAQALATFARARFGDHPLARDLAPAAIAPATAGEVARWLADRYPLARATVAAVGAVTPDDVVAALAPALDEAGPVAAAAAPAAAARPRSERPASHQAVPDQLFVDRADDTSAIVLGHVALAAGDPDRAALDVLAAILDDPRGPLAGLAAVAPARRIAVADTADAGYLALALDQPPDRAAALAAAEAALAAVAAAPPSPAAVAAARDRLVAVRTAAPHARRTWADDLAIAELTGAPDRHAALAAVDAAAVARVARRVLGAATVVTVRPADPTPAVVRQRDRLLPRRRGRARTR